MKPCKCVYTVDYEVFLERRNAMSVSDRLLAVIFEGDFEGEMYASRCESCLREQAREEEHLKVMDALVASSGFPDLEFDWTNPIASYFATLYREYLRVRVENMARSVQTGEMTPSNVAMQIVMHWAGIVDIDEFHRYTEIGMWVAEAQDTATMDYDELDEFYRERDRVEISDEDAAQIRQDAFDFIRDRMHKSVQEKMIIDEMERQFNED